MKPCECISFKCESPKHTDLECSAEATRFVRSRDFDECVYGMCFWCGAWAVKSGIFEEAK